MSNEESIYDEMKQMFEYMEICAEPVYTLAECLSATPDNDDGFDLEADRISDIKERFRTSLYLCDKEQLDFVRFAAELSENRAVLKKVIHYPLYTFVRNDFVFVFSNGGEYYLVLPKELAEIFHEVTGDEGFAAVNAAKLELKMYADALINLYGAYEIKQFVHVWNQHHKDKINLNEAETFLSDMACFHSDYYFIDDYVVHECLFEEDFDDLWDEVYDEEYFMPTKSVIREFAAQEHDFELKTPDEKAMDEFLAGFIEKENELDDLCWEIANSCKRLQSPAEVRTILEEADFPLDDEAAVRQFERLYNRLRDNTRIWELRGFMPYQYAAETGKRVKRFELPKGKKKRGR